jgi:signal transduction histidine kinase
MQLMLPLLTLLLGVVGISTWTGVASAQRARRQIENQVRDIARTLDEAEIPLNDVVLKYLHGLSGAELLFIGVRGARVSSFPEDYEPQPPLEPVSEEEDWQTLKLGRPVVVNGKRYLASGVHLHLPKRAKPSGTPFQTLYILYPESLWQDALWEAIRPSLVLGGFVGVASVALALGVSQRLGRRIQQLERRTRQIAEGDFSPMPLPGRQDELRDLGLSVNDMAANLAQLQDTVQKTERLRLLGQLSGGLAHQLRNGIAGARLAVQLHARECTAQPNGEALQVALRQLSLLEANLRRFLALGHNGPPRRETCSLATLVRDVECLLGPQCRHAGIHWRRQPLTADFLIDGDPDQLAQLLLNVFTNAMEAAGPGGWVAFQVTLIEPKTPEPASQYSTTGSFVEIEVSDSGAGPPPEIAGRLFEVFVTSKPEGVGLGLAVARQVAEAHGGSLVWMRNSKHTSFVINLPAAQQPKEEQSA